MKKTPIPHSQLANGTFEDWSAPYISKKSSSYKNFIREKMTGRVDNIPRRLFEKNVKMWKLKSQDQKNLIFWPISPKMVKNGAFLDTVTSILYFLHFSFLSISTLPVILSFMNFLKFELKKKNLYIRGYPIFICAGSRLNMRDFSSNKIFKN